MEEQTDSTFILIRKPKVLELGDMLKIIRTKLELTQDELEILSKRSTPTIRKLESNRGGQVGTFLDLLDAMSIEMSFTINTAKHGKPEKEA